MGSKLIKIIIGEKEFEAELNNTDTAGQIYDSLPIRASGSTWGDEIYFSIPVDMDNENPQDEVEVGDLAYWPGGNGFCIFYGKTPASTNDKPKPASPVTVIGKIKASPGELRSLSNTKDIKISKTE